MQNATWLKKIVLPQWQIFFLVITTILIAAISEYALKTQLPLEQCPGLRQVTKDMINEWGTDPAIVHVGLQVTHISKFNVIDDRFVFEGKLWFLFDPEIISLDTIKQFSIEKGTITYQSVPELKMLGNLLFAEINIRIKTNSGLIHTAFPLDSHRIFIHLINTNTSPQEFLFHADNTQFIIAPEVHVSEWKPVRHSVATGYTQAILDTDDQNRMVCHPKVLFSIDFNRTGLRHVFIILLPLFLICAMAMMAIGAQEILGGEKALDIALASAASIIAYRFVIESMSPHASTFMVVDYIFTFFLVISCAQVIFTKITYKDNPLPPLALWIRAFILMILYGLFIVIWIGLLLVWIPSQHPTVSCLNTTSLYDKQEAISSGHLSEQKNTSYALGSTLDLSRSDKNFGKQVKQGLMLCFTQTSVQKNEEIPEILFLNDESFPLKAVHNVKKLYKQGINTLLCSVGTSTLHAYLDFAQEKDIAILFPITGALEFRDSNLKNLIHYRVSSAQEGALITRYAIENLGTGRLLIIKEESPFGASAYTGAQQILTEFAIPTEYITTLTYPKGSVNFDSIISHIKSNSPDSILFLSSAPATEELIRQLSIEHLIGKNLLGTSQLHNRACKQFLKGKGLKILISSVVPDPTTSMIPIAQEFRNAAYAAHIPVDAPTFEAFICADLYIYAKNNLPKNHTSQDLVKFFENMKEYTHKGLPFHFDPATRELSTTLWLDESTAEWKPYEKIIIMP